ncbi:peptidylprolyl isomerase [soil metagenome]
MIRLLVLCSLIFFISCSSSKINGASGGREQRVKIITDSGDIVLKLYNKTPLHRDNFIKLVKAHFYDSILFHRVIQKFMIQGGDPKSKISEQGVVLGNGGPGYSVPAEFDTTLFHKKGVIAAAREGDDVNPLRASSGSQFYIVQGKKFTDSSLNAEEKKRGIIIPANRREVYKTIGGTPHLDGKYTVFGEVVSGLEVVDKIASAKTDANNRPVTDVRMRIILLRR